MDCDVRSAPYSPGPSIPHLGLRRHLNECRSQRTLELQSLQVAVQLGGNAPSPDNQIIICTCLSTLKFQSSSLRSVAGTRRSRNQSCDGLPYVWRILKTLKSH